MERRSSENSNNNRGKLFYNSKEYLKNITLAIYSFFYLFFYSLIYPVNNGRGNMNNNSNGNNQRGFGSNTYRGSDSSSYGSCFRFRGMGGG